MNENHLELIMAYHDGELDQEHVARAETLLKESAAAREWLLSLKAGDKFVQQGLAGILSQPVPENVLPAKNTAPASKGRLFHFPATRSPGVRAFAIAASLMLFMAAGFWLDLESDGNRQQQTVASFVAQALESAPSGIRVAHPEAELVVMPLATYETETGQFCRTYAGRFRQARLSGLACRSATSEWVTVVQQTIGSAPDDASMNAYRPATGASDIVTPALTKLGAKGALPGLRESTLLQNNWSAE